MAYFKSPDEYAVVFDKVPPYAHGITRVFGDIGEPEGWEKDSNIAFTGMQTVDGRSLYADTTVYVDPATYQAVRMDWHYVNGGAISMTQTFKDQGPYSAIATQRLEVRIPYVHAVLNASYAAYQMNVALGDAVFVNK